MRKFSIVMGSIALGLPLAGHAQTEPLAHVTVGSTQVSVTQADMSALLKPLDPAVRKSLAADPARLDQVVRSRLAVQAVLAEANAKGWEKQPQVQAMIDEAKRGVILRSYLASVSTPPADYPSEAEIQATYDHNQAVFAVPRAWRIAQIYVEVAPGADAATQDKARQRATELSRLVHGKGADFAALAQVDSDDKVSAARGGDMGFVADATLMPEIRTVVATMKAGDVAGPIQTAEGFHVIKLTDARAAGVAPLAAVKERIRAELRQQREQQNEQAYMAKLVGPAAVSIDEAALQTMTRLRLPMGALLAVAALAVVPAVPVRAQVFIPAPAPAPAPAAQASKRVCVDAEMNGAVALSYDCLNQQLAPTAAASAAGSASNAAEGLATAPSNKVGTFNYSAESIRFGSNWGKSVEPQRPPPVQTAPLR